MRGLRLEIEMAEITTGWYNERREYLRGYTKVEVSYIIVIEHMDVKHCKTEWIQVSLMKGHFYRLASSSQLKLR